MVDNLIDSALFLLKNFKEKISWTKEANFFRLALRIKLLVLNIF